MNTTLSQTKQVDCVKKSDSRRSLKPMFACLILGVLIFFELAGGRSYFDEVLSLGAILYLLYLAVKDELSRYDSVSLFILVVVIFLGLSSNITSGVSRSITSVAIDAIAETKILWVYFAAKYFFRGKTATSFSNVLTPVSKIYIVIGFVCSFISQFVNIGMTESERYGLQGFSFIFPFSFQFLAVSLLAIAVLVTVRAKNRQRYYVLASVSLMLATKSSPLLFGLMFLILLFYFNKHEKLNIFVIAFLFFGIVAVGSYQIQTYLMNVNAPRYLFFLHGAELANQHFPFGTGFATFGSDQAARSYSPLYFQFGFSRLFGLNPEDGSFLSDTFWPMALGQFGWIGFALFIGLFARIFLSFKDNRGNKAESKAFLYSALLSYIIHAIGSAILSSSAGMIGFIAMALVNSPTGESRKSGINARNNQHGKI